MSIHISFADNRIMKPRRSQIRWILWTWIAVRRCH